MKSIEKENMIFIRLFPDEDVNEQLLLVCKKHKLKTAVIISGIGQLKELKIGYFKEKDNYLPKTFFKPLEMLSLTGNITDQKEGYHLHLHIVVGDENKNTYGGHFINGKISITGEIVLLKSSIKFDRKFNKKTGLKDLIIE